jgi:hypothetical protein
VVLADVEAHEGLLGRRGGRHDDELLVADAATPCAPVAPARSSVSPIVRALLSTTAYTASRSVMHRILVVESTPATVCNAQPRKLVSAVAPRSTSPDSRFTMSPAVIVSVSLNVTFLIVGVGTEGLSRNVKPAMLMASLSVVRSATAGVLA